MSDKIQALRSTMSLYYLDNIQKSKKKYASLMEPLCRRHNLTRNELDILLFLANNPGFDRATDIVSMRQIAKSHVSLSVGNLEKRGLLLRQFEAADRRTAHLKLTEVAMDAVQQGQALQQQFFRQVFDGLDHDELVQFGTTLMKICSNIEKITD